MRLVFLVGLLASLQPTACAPVVSVNMADLLWRRILTEGHNECGGTIPCPSARSTSKADLAAAAARGFRVIRFGATGFWPVDHELWLNQSTRALYWGEFDSVLQDARELNVSLVPSLFWNLWTHADVCKEPLSALISGDPATCAVKTAKEYTSELVQRYAHEPTIAYWELTNELNLAVDLDHDGQKTSIAPSLGTPTVRSSLDNFTTTSMMSFQQMMGSWIRQGDKLHRLISTGHAIQRPSAAHLRSSYSSPSRDWTKDTLEEFSKSFVDQCAGCDLCSVHIYPGADNQRFGSPHEYSLLDAAGKALAAVGTKRVYLGEFGVPLPDRHNTSAPTYNYTEEMLAHMRDQMPSQQAPMLATYWQWMAPNQAATWSLFPGKDDRTIRLLQAAGNWTEGV
jgi:hypothetical protein